MGEIRVDAPGLYAMDSDAYHADTFLPAPGLSAGVAKTLINRSPAHAWTSHPRCPWFERQEKQAWDLGSAVHSMILEGEANIVVVQAKDYRTDAAKHSRDIAYERGQIPVLPHQLEECREFAAAIRAQLDRHETDADAFKNGKSEVTVVWQESNGVWCKCRPDWLQSDLSFVDHLKTTGTTTNPADINRWAMDQSHDFIDAWYRRGLKAVTGKIVPGRFISVENSKPFGLTVFTLPKIIQEMADMKVELAIRQWGRSLETGQWPCYPLHRVELDVPPYLTKNWEERVERSKFEDGKKHDPILSRMIQDGIGG